MVCSVGQDSKQSQQHLPRCIDVTIYALLTKSMSRWLDTGRAFFFPILWTENCLFREAGKRANCVCSANLWESFMFPLFRLSSAAFCNSIADVCPFQICFCAGSKWAIPNNQNTGFASYWPRALRYNKCIHIHKHGMVSYWKISHWNKDITSQRAPLTQAP